jgi:hypothetical protein
MPLKNLKGHNSRFVVKLVEDEEKEQSLLFVPDDFTEEDRYVVCELVDSPTATHCLAEKHLVETVKIYGETHTFVSNHAIVCTWEEK